MPEHRALRQDRIVRQSADELHIVSRACVEEKAILFRIGSDPRNILHLETHGLLPFPPFFRDGSDVFPVSCIKDYRGVRRDRSAIRSESDDATASVAAHHPARTVRIEVHHVEILSGAGFEEHHPVGTETGVAVAQMPYHLFRKGQMAVPVVGDEKVIAGPVVFAETLEHYLRRDSSSTDAAVFPSRYFTITGV